MMDEEPIEVEKRKTIQPIRGAHIYRPIYVTNFFDKPIEGYDKGKSMTFGGMKVLRREYEALTGTIMDIQDRMSVVEKGSEDYAYLESKLRSAHTSRDIISKRMDAYVGPERQCFVFHEPEGNVHRVSFHSSTPHNKRRKAVRIGPNL